MNLSADMPFLLAASPQFDDPVFRRAVVLMIEYDSEGAMGFIINNPSHMMLNEVVAYDDEDIPPGIPVWNAGPVDSSSGFILHNQIISRFEKEIAPGVSLSASQDTLTNLIKDAKNSQRAVLTDTLYPYRLLIGYAGWGAGQLESEFRLGAWIKAPIDTKILFGIASENIWKHTLMSVGLKSEGNFAAQNLGWSH